jgi:large subunit ribosomal protein L19
MHESHYASLACLQEVPENKKRVSLLRGIVVSRRNAGINTTFRIRRVIAGVGVEMVFPL